LNYGPFIGYAFYAFPLFLMFYFMWRSSGRSRKMAGLAADNTMAVQENTAAIRELISKLDERKP